MALSDIKTVEWALSNWGAWAFQNRGIALYYPSIEPFERMRAKQSPGANITDDEAQEIDQAVSGMKCTQPDQHEALVLYYIARLSYRDIAREMSKDRDKRIHHRTASDLVQGGRMWVEGALRNVAPLSARG